MKFPILRAELSDGLIVSSSGNADRRMGHCQP